MLNLQGIPRLPISLRAIFIILSVPLLVEYTLLLTQGQEQQQTAVLIEVQLPIQNTNIGGITRALDTAIENAGKATVENQRPWLVIRFLPLSGNNQIRSDFGACNTLESYLSSPSLTRRCRTVAILDGKYADHAFLPILACSKLIVSPETNIHGPESDTSLLTSEVKDDYRRVAEAHKHFPASVIEAVLDPNVALHEVTTDESTFFATGAERQELFDKGKLNSSTAISIAGDILTLDKLIFKQQSAITVMPTNDTTLATELNIAPTRFLKSSGPIGEIHAVVVDMAQLQSPSRIRDKQILINNLADQHNLIIFQFENDGAHTDELINLANTIADLRYEEIKTVAYIKDHARGAAGVLALACDEIYLGPEGSLGGFGNSTELGELTFEIQETLQALEKTTTREWSLFYRCLQPTIELHLFTRAQTGETRAFCPQQIMSLDDKDQWTRGTPLNDRRHFNAEDLQTLGHLQGVASDLSAVLGNYDLKLSDVEIKTTTGLSGFLNEVAHSNWFLWATLTMAIYGLIAELAAPGLGVPGLISLLGFGLHIWARHLNGTVDALEIILILIGVICIGVELFVTPGFGLFGIGGICSLLFGLILSAQSFSLPTNPFQRQQIANSVLGIIGTIVGTVLLYQISMRLLGDSWIGRVIAPKNNDLATAQRNNWNEAMVHWEHLVGQTGQTTSRLSPAGKARLGSKVYDVVSDGEMVSANSMIKVIEVTGNRIVVSKSS